MTREPWRVFVWPLAFLLAATVVVVLVRVVFEDDGPAAKTPATQTGKPAGNASARAQPRFYRVRAGDTLEKIAAATGVPIERLHKLNPAVEPTSLFIGARLRLQ